MTNSLDSWLAQEADILARRNSALGVGLAKPEQIVGKTGLEIMQSIVSGEIPTPPIASTLDFFLIEVGDGHAVFQGTPKAEHFNPMGTIHGGWFATLLDSALGCAVHTKIPAGRSYTTSQLSVNLVKALMPKIQRVRAIGRVIHCGRQLATAEAQLIGPDGTLYAHATTTCLIFDMK